jgi:hypothetical protein
MGVLLGCAVLCWLARTSLRRISAACPSSYSALHLAESSSARPRLSTAHLHHLQLQLHLLVLVLVLFWRRAW